MSGEHVTLVRSAVAARPPEIYERVVDEGRARLESSLLQLASRAFVAGSTIVFGIVALGIVHSLVAQQFGRAIGDVSGAIAFGIGFVFLVVGRSDLFSENFLDPVAAAVQDGRRMWLLLPRLWVVTLVANLVGGAALVLVLSVDGTMPDDGHEPLIHIADEILALPASAAFTRAIAAGAVLTLMTWLLQAAGSAGARMAIAWAVGTFVAIGPFNHVVVTLLHLAFGHAYGVPVAVGEYLQTLAIATAGNVVGGLGFVTLARLGQVKGAARAG